MESSKSLSRLCSALALCGVAAAAQLQAAQAGASITESNGRRRIPFDCRIACRHLFTFDGKTHGGEFTAFLKGTVEYPLADGGIALELTSTGIEKETGRLARKPTLTRYTCRPMPSATVKGTWQVTSGKEPGSAEYSTGVQVADYFLPALSASRDNRVVEKQGVFLHPTTLRGDTVLSATLPLSPVQDKEGKVVAYEAAPKQRAPGSDQTFRLLFLWNQKTLEILEITAAKEGDAISLAREWFVGPRKEGFVAFFDHWKSDHCSLVFVQAGEGQE